MEQALQGMKVIDLSQVLAGPYCTMVLGDMGADVTKVEKYPNGDDTRSMGPYINEESYLYMMVNRNKRGMCLNLKSEDGIHILYKLIKEADVFVENFRPGVTKKLGIDYDTLKAMNPNLIYCSISGYGQTGPYSKKGGFDIMAQGMSGLMEMTGEKDGKPVKVGIAIHDIAAAQTAIQSILSAYIHRLKGGKGQYIDVSLVDSGLAWTVWEAAAYFGKGEIPQKTGTAHRAAAPYQGYQTKDGHILIGAANQKLWETFCLNVVKKREWLTDPRFLTNSLRAENVQTLEKEIEHVLIQHPSNYWLQLLEVNGIPSGPIYSYDETLHDPHIRERAMILDYEHPIGGNMQTLGFPAKLSLTPGQLKKPAPLLGQHNEEILQELGYDAIKMEDLNEKEVIK
ncbi:CaiB/BaiF CoA transferase family protein [Pseudogracilibacillus auburnensis]|uniref:Formyl-CoA transferase n=1 Tax=Pseudogracilibacillus auburnensis TaxID=1494959 RepID=A0A2V3WD62_9BACI|nr:CoA transferase [Pseudogracilibacillus auburnensis]MBO1001920.1 CoA transferase [Pseudogracilibacillus auburnensis]PXW90135.1 formyl-CoA transferase [Pseudogracilibacillus auburnensis]